MQKRLKESNRSLLEQLDELQHSGGGESSDSELKMMMMKSTYMNQILKSQKGRPMQNADLSDFELEDDLCTGRD